MLRVNLRRVKPGQEERLRAWFREVMTRKDEVRATFRQETVRHEVAFILQDSAGPILLYAIEAEDHERGRAASQASQLPIDIQHRRVMREALGERLEVEPVYECTLE